MMPKPTRETTDTQKHIAANSTSSLVKYSGKGGSGDTCPFPPAMKVILLRYHHSPKVRRTVIPTTDLIVQAQVFQASELRICI